MVPPKERKIYVVPHTSDFTWLVLSLIHEIILNRASSSGGNCESRFLGIPNSPNLNVAVSLNINCVSDFSQIRGDPISDRLQKPPAW